MGLRRKLFSARPRGKIIFKANTRKYHSVNKLVIALATPAIESLLSNALPSYHSAEA